MANSGESLELDSRGTVLHEMAATRFPPPSRIAYHGMRRSFQPTDEEPDPDGPKYFRSIELHDLPTSVPSLRSILGDQKTWQSERDSLQLNDDEESILLRYWGPSLETIGIPNAPDDFPLSILMIDRHFLPHHPVARVRDQIAREESSLELPTSGLDLASFEGLLELMRIKAIGGIEKNFQNIRLIASGSTFQVFLSRYSGAEDDQGLHLQPGLQNGDRVAMKKIYANATSTQSQSETALFHVPRAVVQELRILAATGIQRHANIIKLFALAWDIADGISSHKLEAPVMIQEYAEYGNLQDFLRAAESDELLSSTLKTSLCSDIAAGLQALHSHGIIHGDVKCENILVSRGDCDDKFVAKVSDFGFSVIVRSSDHLVDIPINLQGTTLRYAAPELYAQRESMNVKLARNEAHKIDIYSYALLVYIVALSGQDMFGVLADLQYELGKVAIKVREEMVREFEWNEEVRDVVIQSTIKSTKLNARAGIWVRNVLRVTVKESDLGFVDAIFPILEAMLVQDPQTRCSDFTIVWKSLASGSETQSRQFSGYGQDFFTDENTQTPRLPAALANRWEIFWIDGHPLQLGIHEIRFSHELMLFPSTWSDASRRHVFDVWKAKAAILNVSANISKLTIEARASAAFCAHQAAICYLYGNGTEASYLSALDLIIKSARGGYITALCFVQPICEAFGVACPDDLPVLDALEHRVAIGPAYGHFAWSHASRSLKRLDGAIYTRACKLLNSNAWLEIGERDGRWGDGIEGVMGGDPRFFYIPWGTYDAALWCVHTLPPPVFFEFLEQGSIMNTFPNYNNETLLYICCRAGRHEKVIGLLDRYESARAEVGTPTKNGMVPIHWMFAINTVSDAQTVLKLLLENGADLSVQSHDCLMPIEYALMHDRAEIADLLYSHESENVWTTDHTAQWESTLCLALNYHAFDLARRMMETAAFENIESAVSALYSARMEARIAWHASTYRTSCMAIFRFLRDCRLDSLKDKNISRMFASTLRKNILWRTTDVVQALLDHDFFELLTNSQDCCTMLIFAARWSQPMVFQKVLTLTKSISVPDAKELLNMVIISPGPGQLAIAQMLVDRLVGDGVIGAAVNSIEPAEGLAEDDKEVLPFKQLWNAIDEEVFDIADLLSPFDQYIKGQQRTVMHTLLNRKPVRERVILQLEYLIDRGSPHADLVCNPSDGNTVMHETIFNYDAFSTEWQFRDVLGFILEHYSHGIDKPNRHGLTPLHLAAGSGCPTAVETLLDYGASPDALVADLGKTAFDLAFHGVLRSMPDEASEAIYCDKRISKNKGSRLLQSKPRHARRAQYVEVLSKLLDNKGHPHSQQIYFDNGSAALVTRPEFHKSSGMQTRVSMQKNYTEEQWEALVRKSLQVDSRGHTHLLALYGPVVFSVDLGHNENVGGQDFSEEEILELLHGEFKYRHGIDSQAPNDGFRKCLKEASQSLMRQEEE